MNPPSSTTKSRVNEAVVALPPSGIREFFDLVIGMDDLISLGVGEPDFVTPWNVREQAIFTMEKGYTTYTSNKGLLELRREIAKYMEERFDQAYSPEDEVLVTVGASQGLDLSMRAILNPGDEVIVTEPCYVAYTPMVRLAGGVPKILQLKYENTFRLDADELESLITPRTKAMLLNYPCNPTGSTFREEECRRIAEIAEKHDLIMITDEIYAELTYDQEHFCMANMPGARDRTIVLNGFSKAFAMTGWRMGFAAGPPDLIAAMTKIFQYSMLSAPIMSQYAAVEALKSRKRNVPGMIESYHQRRNYFVQGLRDIGIDCHLPEGAFYAFPSIEKFGITAREFCTRLLKEEKVAVVPGSAFTSNGGEKFLRCSYAVSMDELKQALEAMERLIKRIQAGD
ncbi:MAG: aminotransferase class I/II-fold pyridoxal phosphate-dependent enzyme [Candidatus Sumerlaeia bacterium]